MALDLLLLLLLLVDLVCGEGGRVLAVAPGDCDRGSVPTAPSLPADLLVSPPRRRRRKGTGLALRHRVPRKGQQAPGQGVESNDPDLAQAGLGAQRAGQGSRTSGKKEA